MTFTYTDFANGLWDPTANTLGRVAALSDTLILLAIDPLTYIADPDADVSLADVIAAGGIIATSDPITGLTVVTRGLTFDPVTFPLVAVGPDIGAVVLCKDTGTPATSPLMVYADDAATGLPVTTTGFDVVFNPGPGGIAVF